MALEFVHKLFRYLALEQFLTEEVNQGELKLTTRNLLEARENAGYQVGIGCSFAFDWL